MQKFLGLPFMKGFTSFSFELLRIGYITLFFGIGLLLTQQFMGVMQSPDITVLQVSISVVVGLIVSHIAQYISYKIAGLYMYFGYTQIFLYPVLVIISVLSSLDIL